MSTIDQARNAKARDGPSPVVLSCFTYSLHLSFAQIINVNISSILDGVSNNKYIFHMISSNIFPYTFPLEDEKFFRFSELFMHIFFA